MSFWLHGCWGEWEGWVRKPVNHTSWLSVVTPTDRPKLVRNLCVIELFGDLFVLSRCPFDISVGIGVFVLWLCQISFYFLFLCEIKPRCFWSLSRRGYSSSYWKKKISARRLAQFVLKSELPHFGNLEICTSIHVIHKVYYTKRNVRTILSLNISQKYYNHNLLYRGADIGKLRVGFLVTRRLHRFKTCQNSTPSPLVCTPSPILSKRSILFAVAEE